MEGCRTGPQLERALLVLLSLAGKRDRQTDRGSKRVICTSEIRASTLRTTLYTALSSPSLKRSPTLHTCTHANSLRSRFSSSASTLPLLSSVTLYCLCCISFLLAQQVLKRTSGSRFESAYLEHLLYLEMPDLFGNKATLRLLGPAADDLCARVMYESSCLLKE